MTAYAIFLHENTKDAAEMERYGALVGPTLEGHSATLLAKHGALDVLEGAPLEDVVILSFPTMADARSWYHSPAYQDVARHRFAGATFRGFLTEGPA